MRRAGTLRFMSRRAIAAGLMAVGLCCLPGPARADGPAREGGRLAERWEDMLLLQALRYLQVTPGQAGQMLALSTLPGERNDRLRADRARTRASLERLLRKHRDALLQGRACSTTDQEQVLLLWRTLEQTRERTTDETVTLLAARLARILAREQTGRAFRLARGDWPPEQGREPDLLEPLSGFVVAEGERQQWRDQAIRQALARRYGRQVADALPPRPQMAFINAAQLALEVQATGFLVESYAAIREEGEPKPPDDPVARQRETARQVRIQAAAREAQALRQRDEALSQQFAEGATDAEIASCLLPLARRLFLSSRFRDVLEDRLAPPGDAAPAPAAGTGVDDDEGLARTREEVLLLDALRYLRLSREQLERLRELADRSAQLVSKQREANAPALAQLEQFALAEHSAVLHGQTLPAEQQEQALALARGVRDRWKAAEDEVLKARAADLGRLLSRSQVARAHLLARGAWPREEAKSLLLLDPASGFVLEPDARQEWQRAALRSVLARRFADDVVERALASELSGPGGARALLDTTRLYLGRSLDLLAVKAGDTLRVLNLSERGRGPEDLPERVLPPQLRAAREAAGRDRDALEEAWPDANRFLRPGTPEEDLATALRPLARRLFFSPRLPPVLREWRQRY